MADTQDLIETLSAGAQPIKFVAAPVMLFIKWLIVSLTYVGASMIFIGLRPDLVEKLQAPLFLLEILSLAAIAIASGISAIFLSFPDLCQRHSTIFAPIIPLLIFMAIIFLEWLVDVPPAPPPPHGIDCLLCISLLSFLPAGWLLYIIRHNASVHYHIAGGVALLAATSLGCLGLRLAEQTDSITHLVQWHYFPMLGFGMLGIWFGGKILKW